MPSPTTAGVLGMARITGFSVPSINSSRSVPTPAMIEISSVSRRSPALRSVASTTGASLGLTHNRIRSAPDTRAWKSESTVIPSASEAASQVAGFLSPAQTRSCATSFPESSPRSSVWPITPAPMTPSVAPSPITGTGSVCSDFFEMEMTSIQAREEAERSPACLRTSSLKVTPGRGGGWRPVRKDLARGSEPGQMAVVFLHVRSARPCGSALELSRRSLHVRFYIDAVTGAPHIHNHGVDEEEVMEVLERPAEDRGPRGFQDCFGPDSFW